MPALTMVDADYTAKNGVGTLMVATDDREVAGNLRDAFFAIQAATAAGLNFRLVVVTER